MDYAILATELQQPQYAGLTDAEIVATLNATTQERQAVPIAILQSTAMDIGVYTAIRTAVLAASTPDDLRAVCQTVLDLAQARFDTVDLDSPGSVAMFAALLAAGVITAEQAATIDSLADHANPSRATILGLGAVALDDIRAARDWQAAQDTERERLAAYAALRERLVNGGQVALAWLRAAQDAGEPVPAWPDVIGQM